VVDENAFSTEHLLKIVQTQDEFLLSFTGSGHVYWHKNNKIELKCKLWHFLHAYVSGIHVILFVFSVTCLCIVLKQFC